jgi:YgiT-type zinc finger domain-containing protein
MKCTACKSGEIRPGVTAVTLNRAGATVVIKSVPARICGTCGEAYIDSDVTQRLLEQARDAARPGVEVEIRGYAPA